MSRVPCQVPALPLFFVFDYVEVGIFGATLVGSTLVRFDEHISFKNSWAVSAIRFRADFFSAESRPRLFSITLTVGCCILGNQFHMVGNVLSYCQGQGCSLTFGISIALYFPVMGLYMSFFP